MPACQAMSTRSPSPTARRQGRRPALQDRSETLPGGARRGAGEPRIGEGAARFRQSAISRAPSRCARRATSPASSSTSGPRRLATAKADVNRAQATLNRTTLDLAVHRDPRAHLGAPVAPPRLDRQPRQRQRHDPDQHRLDGSDQLLLRRRRALLPRLPGTRDRIAADIERDEP